MTEVTTTVIDEWGNYLETGDITRFFSTLDLTFIERKGCDVVMIIGMQMLKKSFDDEDAAKELVDAVIKQKKERQKYNYAQRDQMDRMVATQAVSSAKIADKIGAF